MYKNECTGRCEGVSCYEDKNRIDECTCKDEGRFDFYGTYEKVGVELSKPKPTSMQCAFQEALAEINEILCLSHECDGLTKSSIFHVTEDGLADDDAGYVFDGVDMVLTVKHDDITDKFMKPETQQVLKKRR